MKTILATVLALCFVPAVAFAQAPPCPEGQVCTAPTPCPEGETCEVPQAEPAPPPPTAQADQPTEPPPLDAKVTTGPPVNLHAVETTTVGAEPPIELHPVGLLPLPPLETIPAAPVAVPDTPVAPDPYRHHYGLQLDLGVPDAVALGFVYRPIKYVRGEVAGTYNTLAPGVRAGVTVLPLFGRILSATVEGGYYADGNANKYSGSHQEAVLDSVGYKYANFHLGLDLGREHATFFIHGGMSYLSTEIKDLNQQFTGVTFGSNPTLTAWFPSFKLGLIVYL